ncbi:hypothetical protein Acr_23g0016350 [Actinidia rufa]|uniref:Uncharacterized protein n=1 Tax=Actinidia rufa TaxID=165716 RepID=A0A7J0GR16_9ERIC|nr:hypothetical protein Acr_23g0016350 [Actinidia rufa]
MYPDVETASTATVIAVVAPPVKMYVISSICTLKSLRRALELKEVASVEITAPVTHAPARDDKAGFGFGFGM